MYCGNCLRDNAMVADWSRLGHDVCMVPLYLPLTLDEPDQSADVPVFFGGINVFMSHKIPRIWQFVPEKVRRWLDSRSFLKSIGRRVSKTNPAEVGSLTVSMLKGATGSQRRELLELADWLKEHKPDVLSFSNALILGMHQHLRSVTGAKTLCFLSGEDTFLDELPEPHKTQAWRLVREHVSEIDVLIAPSRYYAALMSERLNLPQERIHVVHSGINTDGFAKQNKDKQRKEDQPESNTALVLGYFARMSETKGLAVLVDAFIEIRQRGTVPNLQLKIGGNLNPWNKDLLERLQNKLAMAGLSQDVRFYPNVSREAKIQFLQSLDIFSVPSVGDEPFGFYAVEALVAGVPVVLPAKSSFPELIEMSGGGVLYPPDDFLALVEVLETLCADKSRRQYLGKSGRNHAWEYFSIRRASNEVLELIR